MSEHNLPNLVAMHYEGGEFGYLIPDSVVDNCEKVGDGLFRFLVHEALDAEDLVDLIRMVDRAERQLRNLKSDLEAVLYAD